MSGTRKLSPIRGERRSVTALFADITDFTGHGERLDPEDLTELVRACFSELIEEIRIRGGWLERHTGDALVAVFGAPVAHEDDPVRAVEAALAMVDRTKAMNERVRDGIGAPLDVHVGINTGLVVVAPALGHGTSESLMALGDAVTTAARLQQAAKPGQILVGRSTYEATDRYYEYRQLPPLRLKGKRDRVTAWSCLGRRDPQRDRRELLPRERLPLVGRSVERTAVSRCFELLVQGTGGLLLITGEPGIGKTRLLRHARTQAERQPLLWLQASTVSYGEAGAYGPFVKVLRDLAGTGRKDEDAVALEKLESNVAELFPAGEAEEALPYLGTLLALELPAELAQSVRFLDGEGVGLQIFRAMRRLFERLAQRQPLALVFEDWHWADDTSAALLEHLLPLYDSVPILLCCSTRPRSASVQALRGRAQELGLGERVTELELKPLSAAEAQELISSLAEGVALSPRNREEILETAEGNPFFIEEILRSLAGEGDPVARIEIPHTLHGAIIARVDRLPGELRRLLKVASVLGRRFPYALLRELAETAEIDGPLDQLIEAELVRELPRAGERTFAFKHAITQEVVYSTVLLAHRRKLHVRIAELLESTYGDRLDELAGTVAFHYAQAQDWERAQEFLFRAGDHAGAVAASAEALAYYGKAVDASSRAFGQEWDDRQRAELDRKIGEAFFRRGEHDRAAEYLERGLACLGFDYPRKTAHLRLVVGVEAVRQAWHRLLPLPAYRRIRDEADPWMDELSRIFDTLGWIYFFSDPERVVLDSFRQLNTAERRGHRLAIVRASTGLGFVFDAIPMRRLAGSYHRRAVTLSARLENRRSVGIAHLGQAHHQRFQLAALDDALENYTRAADECRRAGDLRGQMGATLMLAEITAITGELGASLDYGRQLLEVGDEAGDHQVQGWGHHALGRTLRIAGALERARVHLERGCELSSRVPDYPALVVARGNLGLSLTEAGHVDDARAVLEATQQLARERRLRSFASTDMLNALTTTYLAAAEHADGDARHELMRNARKACHDLSRQRRLDRAAAPAILRLQGTYHWLRGEHGKAEKLWRQSIASAEALRLPYEVGRTQLEVGVRTSEKAIGTSGRALLNELALRAGSDDQADSNLESSRNLARTMDRP
jgi:class 3 adenylate cyclase/tetratricopeptide (TPR) repeat protein